jgi:hypothetical protein
MGANRVCGVSDRPSQSRPSGAAVVKLFPRAGIVLQKDHRDEAVDARVGRQVKDEARESPVKLMGTPPLESPWRPLERL